MPTGALFRSLRFSRFLGTLQQRNLLNSPKKGLPLLDPPHPQVIIDTGQKNALVGLLT